MKNLTNNLFIIIVQAHFVLNKDCRLNQQRTGNVSQNDKQMLNGLLLSRRTLPERS